ncbi:response regulator [Flammeovirgaceae bacterium SG7u.111]|nr:response regulator [Flammeovirgaceae bacterium SG7u.132]WPO38362.1 response regulator [Flammeovirgaceae bacterium SG7u.111]
MENAEVRTQKFTPPSQGGRVLYVDDEVENLTSFKYVFRKRYEVYTASSGDEGMKILESCAHNNREIQLVITDQRMPKMTGIEFLEKVAECFPDAIRIILTGYSDAEAMMQAINVGRVYRYITKPWKKNELQVNIDNALGAYRLKKQNELLIKNLKQKNRELKQSEEKFSLAFYIAPVAMSMIEVESSMLSDVNQSFEDLVGQKKEQLVGKGIEELSYWGSKVERERVMGIIRSEGRLFNFEHQFLTSDKKIRIVRTSTLTIEIKDKPHYFSLHQDITEERRAEERIIATILETEDKERTRMAHELHDGMGQHLTVASLNFDVIRNEIKTLDERSQEMFKKGMDFLTKAISDSRHMAHNLMPKTVSDFGYVSAVEDLLTGIQGVNGMDIDFFHNLGEQRLKESMENGLFRITQEALNNILKHAEANKVTLQLMKYEDMVILTVEDNGKGFEPDKPGGFGLNSMSTRTKAISGELSIDSHLGRGTNITVQVPLKNENHLL